MNWHAAAAAAALAVGAVAGADVALRRRVPSDPYLAHLEERIDALLPAVERELGASIPGPIRVVVSTREEICESSRREMRDLLRAIEGEPTDETPTAPDGVAGGLLGLVDADATIHVCRQELEGAPYDDETNVFFDKVIGSGKVRSDEAARPEALDRVLVHELVHVYQSRALHVEACLRGARHRSDLRARCAVIEGHAEAVTARVMGRPALGATKTDDERAKAARVAESVAETYAMFEIETDGRRAIFPYVQGRTFVESAIARLGRDAAVRRLFDEPPSLLQVVHPETWPGAPAPDSGTDAMLRRARTWLDTEWAKTECGPQPASVFLQLLGVASVGTQRAAADALIEVQRIETTDALPVWRHAMRGHLLAARDEEGARTLYDAWVKASRARDELVPRDPKLRDLRVLASEWADAAIDGTQALLATRRYRGHPEEELEHAVVVRRGRYVLELRLVDDPGGAPSVLRLARRLLACVADGPRDAGASGWDARWRFAADSRSATERLRPLLVDADPDVRHAALSNLLHRGALTADERDRARHDVDTLVRLTALAWCPANAKPNENDLLAAVRDEDPWVAAGGFLAARAHYMDLTGETIAHALRRPEVTVRRAASGLVKDWGRSGQNDEQTLALVRMALADEDAGVRRNGAAPMLHIASATPGLAETFVQILTGPDEELRAAAVRHLSIREPVPGTAAALIPLLENEALRDEAIDALAKSGEEALPAVPTLRRIAEEAERARDTERRLHALVALGTITCDPAEAVGAVRRLLATGTNEEARTAARVLDGLGTAAADLLPEMTGRLTSHDRGLVLILLDVLEKLGVDARPELPAIETLCDGGDPVVGKRARETRDAIRKRAAAASRK